MYFEFFETNVITQMAHEPNRQWTILDLVWSEKVINKTSVTALIAYYDYISFIISLNGSHTVK